jgi:hypothetical protein
MFKGLGMQRIVKHTPEFVSNRDTYKIADTDEMAAMRQGVTGIGGTVGESCPGMMRENRPGDMVRTIMGQSRAN